MKWSVTGGYFLRITRVGIDDEKALLHSNICGLYMSDKISLIKGGFSVEVSGSYGKKLL